MGDQAVIDRLSIEIDNLTKERDDLQAQVNYWQGEALAWAQKFGAYRQASEQQMAELIQERQRLRRGTIPPAVWLVWTIGLLCIGLVGNML